MYEKLYEENKGLLWYWAKRYKTTSVADVEDLAQAGFFGLVDAARTYNEKNGAWSAWASMYIRKEMRQVLGLRGKRCIETVSLDAPISDAGEDTIGALVADDNAPELDAALLQGELVQAVREAVGAIREDLPRAAVRCVYLKEMSYAETSEALGVHQKAISGLIQKGKEQMRRRLIRTAPDLDWITKFHAHKGVQAFQSDMTSVVEAAVLWREEQRRGKHYERND